MTDTQQRLQAAREEWVQMALDIGRRQSALEDKAADIRLLSAQVQEELRRARRDNIEPVGERNVIIPASVPTGG